MTYAPKTKIQRGIDKAVRRERRRFDQMIHANLTDYLDQHDAGTGATIRDTIIGAMHRGFGVKVGVQLQEPEQQTELEAQAEASGIEIVKA